MSNTISGGDSSGESNATPAEGTPAGEESFDAQAIFNAELEKIAQEEGNGQKKATEFNSIPQGGEAPAEGEGDEAPAEGGGGDEAPAEGGEETSNEGDSSSEEEGGSEQEQESEGEEEVEKKPRNDWKKEALESRNKLSVFEDRLNELAEKIAAKANTELPELGELNTDDLSQEVKDLLEYTPGLDKLIASEGAKAAAAIIEKYESDRATKLQETEQSKEVEGKEQSYWGKVDTWLSNQYPDLVLSEIRESPDFTDWLEHRKTWVDSKLSGADRFDTSGAQAVFERFITENNLAQPQEENTEKTNRKLAAARTPSVGKKSAPPAKGSTNLFAEEVAKLNAQPNMHRRI
jgi:hypothetical protein